MIFKLLAGTLDLYATGTTEFEYIHQHRMGQQYGAVSMTRYTGTVCYFSLKNIFVSSVRNVPIVRHCVILSQAARRHAKMHTYHNVCMIPVVIDNVACIIKTKTEKTFLID